MMIHKTVVEFAKPAHEVFRWLHHLGGPGLIVLGLIDNSVIPVPGSMDALTIILSANQRKLWPYYALMATIGSVIGGYLTYPFHFVKAKVQWNPDFPGNASTKSQKHLRSGDLAQF